MTKEEAAAVAELFNERSELEALLLNWLEASPPEVEEGDEFEEEPSLEKLVAGGLADTIGRMAFGRFGLSPEITSPSLMGVIMRIAADAEERIRTVAKERIIEIDGQLRELTSPGASIMVAA